jgi:DivIVA domain-containing protein
MRKKDAAMDGGSEWSAPTGAQVTPLDVQQKEFRVTRVGVGYRMREVDEFLDQVTDTLSALIAENERLRLGGPVTAASDAAPVIPASSPADRGAVDAFLQREKGFLQDLGGLVQAHAEELRSMIRSARAATPADPAVASPGPEASLPTASADAAEPTVMGDEPPAAVEDAERSEEPAFDDGEGDAAPATITGTTAEDPVPAEEPIRLEEPTPARSGRPDEQQGDSLRELFWGEE